MCLTVNQHNKTHWDKSETLQRDPDSSNTVPLNTPRYLRWERKTSAPLWIKLLQKTLLEKSCSLRSKVQTNIQESQTLGFLPHHFLEAAEVSKVGLGHFALWGQVRDLRQDRKQHSIICRVRLSGRLAWAANLWSWRSGRKSRGRRMRRRGQPARLQPWDEENPSVVNQCFSQKSELKTLQEKKTNTIRIQVLVVVCPSALRSQLWNLSMCISSFSPPPAVKGEVS